MKIPSFFIILVLFSACRKVDPPLEVFLPANQENGSMKGTKSAPSGWAVDWEAGGYAIYESNRNFFFLNGTTQLFDGSTRESVGIAAIPVRVGRTEIKRQRRDSLTTFGVYHRLIADGDVLDGVYRIDTTAANSWIEVMALDTVAKTVSGRFELHFVLEKYNSQREYPKKLSFTDVKFDMKFIR
jgi:hypothetical protein